MFLPYQLCFSKFRTRWLLSENKGGQQLILDSIISDTHDVQIMLDMVHLFCNPALRTNFLICEMDIIRPNQ